MSDKSHGNDGKKGNGEGSTSLDSHSSHKSHQPVQRPNIPPRGDYQTLLCCEEAEVV
jgi:hypothetical protein